MGTGADQRERCGAVAGGARNTAEMGLMVQVLDDLKAGSGCRESSPVVSILRYAGKSSR
jgi:hypothetical protein